AGGAIGAQQVVQPARAEILEQYLVFLVVDAVDLGNRHAEQAVELRDAEEAPEISVVARRDEQDEPRALDAVVRAPRAGDAGEGKIGGRDAARREMFAQQR